MNAESFNRELGLAIKRLREKNRMTQQNLSDQTGLSRATIANIEAGRQALSAYMACVFADLFRCVDLNNYFPDIKSNQKMHLRSHSELTDKQKMESLSVVTNAIVEKRSS